MPLHQLALPLPPSYSYNERENFSFFTSIIKNDNLNSSNEVNAFHSHEKLLEYLGDLCAFVKSTRLIQNHPEDYFEYEEQLLRHYCNQHTLSEPEKSEEESEVRKKMCDNDQVELELKSDHFDFTGVTVSDLKYTMRLCNAFGPLITDNTFSNVQSLIRDGPPPPPEPSLSSSESMMCEMDKVHRTLSEVHEAVDLYTELREFYKQIKRLQMYRHPVDARRVASETLSPMWEPSEQQVLQENNNTESHQCEVSTTEESDLQKERIMSLVLNRGMSVKKRYEVQIMEMAIANLIHCINNNSSSEKIRNYKSNNINSDTYNLSNVNTMINIGEGKGYVSRAVALCDALQVIGLDCNPNHREGAVQRIEQLLEDSLATRHYTTSSTNQYSIHKIVNLLYDPRGKMYSIACSVDSNLNWHNLLSPYVSVYNDTSMSQTESYTTSNNNSNINTQKNETTVITKQKDEREDEDIAEEWLRKKQFDSTNAALMKVADICVINSKNNTIITLERAHVVRGTRVIIAAIHVDVKSADKNVKKSSYCTKASESYSKIESNHDSHNVNDEKQMLTEYTLCDEEGYCIITVIGYDEASHRHRIVYDHIPGIHYISLYKPKHSHELESKWKEEHEYKSHSAHPSHSSLCNVSSSYTKSINCVCNEERRDKIKHACILECLPFVSSVHYPIAVPSLHNCILVGLHTCGNLGSDICRLFTQCSAHGLLLVSCCWHALTTHGFPLSNALRCRSMTLSQLSLQLATQPADMWATADPVGHRSSAKLLFFRSLLKLLWRKMNTKWTECNRTDAIEQINFISSSYSSCSLIHTENDNNYNQTEMCSNNENCCCALPAVPHLEPGFLRRMAKCKDTITFNEFVHEVCTEYIYPMSSSSDVTVKNLHENTNSCKCISDTEKKCTAHDNYWQSTCSVCKGKHISFIRQYMDSKTVNELGDRYMACAFSGFLGFTVLRMWMCHLLESLLLLDRVLFLHEAFVEQDKCHTTLSLVPLFDGKLSPRSFAIMTRRF